MAGREIAMSVLVFNAGSSTLKYALFAKDTFAELASGVIDWSNDTSAGIDQVLSDPAVKASPPSAVGHRVVHGGTKFQQSARITPEAKAALEALTKLAPLHNPPALKAITAAEHALPGVPQIAVFDTAFFANLPPSQHVYPAPYDWHTQYGIRRFGFHGISHEYCASRAAEMLGRADARIVVCHMGNGCSASAVRGREPIATTMGYTPMEGLMMGTRSGSIDPGILLAMQRDHGLNPQALDEALNKRSGLLGVSGVSSDYRKVEAAAAAGDERARLALEIFAARLRSEIGALAVTLGGIDALVFTAGIGEHAASLRAAVCPNLACLGVKLDPALNASSKPDADIAAKDSAVRVFVIHTREELLIAREAARLM